jgi:preprotein translocase subunit SecA
MRNRSRRIDRQLMGRAARHGDPGSAEMLVSLQDRLLQDSLPGWVRGGLQGLTRWLRKLPARRAAPGPHTVPAELALAAFVAAQRLAEWRDSMHRRELRHADQAAAETYGFSGGLE